MSRHFSPLILAVIAILSGLLQPSVNTAMASATATIVYPDTLKHSFNRHAITAAMRPARKTVGLALSGGGANGIAQIGVLKALEDEKIPVDCIAGTSIGAIIGGLYSSGYRAAELEALAGTIPWSTLVSLDDDSPRTNSYVEQKNIRDRATISIRFNGLQLVVPKSLSSAQTLTQIIDLLVLNARYHATGSFSGLPVSFRAVTTDLVKGKRVTLSSGGLSEAMRASSTIPILYQPIERSGYKLADGGLVANLPVDELVHAGAGCRVAVDTHGKMYTDSEDIDIPWKVADQAMTILTQVQYPVQLELANIVIAPDLQDHKATDFSNLQQLVDAGYASGKLAASAIRKQIKGDIGSDIDIRQYKKTFSARPSTPGYSELVNIAERIILHATHVKHCLRELLETDLFSRVHAEIDRKKSTVHFVLTQLPAISRVELVGAPAGVVTNAERDSIFWPIIGTLYTNGSGTRVLEDLVSLYRKKGYSLVGISSVSVDDNVLQVTLSSGKINNIVIEQDKNITTITPIMRELSVDTTKALCLHDVEQSMNHLYGIGIFNRVSVRTESAAAEADARMPEQLTFRLDEKPSGVLRLGLRYDETSNTQLLVDFRNENLRGTTNSFGGWAKVSEDNNRLNLEFSMPRIGATPLTMLTRAFYDQRDISTRLLFMSEQQPVAVSGGPRPYGIQRYGVTTAFGTTIRKNARLVTDITLQNAQSYTRNRYVDELSTGDLNMMSFGAEFTLDTRNSAFLPSEGRNMNIRYSFNPSYLNSNQSFWQLVASHEENFRVGTSATAHLSAVAGISGGELPFSEKFFVGGLGNTGSYRFIGLKNNDLIGSNMAVVSAKLRYKPELQFIFPTSLLFSWNIGNAWSDRSDITLAHLVQGIGAGLVWETPVGPARLTMARSFSVDQADLHSATDADFSKTLFYFSLGHDF